MGLEEREAVYEAVLGVTEKPEIDADSDEVYLGEPNKNHLEGSQKGPFNANNPFIAPIAESSELFTAKDRNCLHMEISVWLPSVTLSSQSKAWIPRPRFPFLPQQLMMLLSAITWRSVLPCLVNSSLPSPSSRPTTK